MAHGRDDSMLFSLRGLLDLEKERLERESAERRRQEEVAQALERERERIRREAEDRKRSSMIEAARLAEQRRREEEARLEALKQAAVECARVEAESRARAELTDKVHEHERALTLLKEEARRTRARHLSAAGFALFAISLVTSTTLYFAKLRPEAQRLHAAFDELVSAEHNRAEETKRLLERAERRRSELESELETAKKRIDTLESEKTTPASDTPARGGTVPAATKPGASRAGNTPCVDDGDPMNPCLK